MNRTFTFTHDREFDRVYDLHPGRFSPDGRLIAAGLKGRGIALLDTRTLKPSGALGDTGGEVKALAFSHDGRRLASVASSGEGRVWGLDARSRPLQRRFSASGFRYGVEFSADGTTLVTNGGPGVLRLDVATRGERAELGEAARELAGLGESAGTSGATLSADGGLVAFTITGGGSPIAEVWDAAKRRRVLRVEAGPEGDTFSVALNPAGSLVAVGGYPRLVRVWNVRTGKLVDELDAGGGEALEFSPDGSILAIAGIASGRVVGGVAVSLWDVQTGIEIGSGFTAGKRAASIDISADGRRLLITAANGQGAVWDIDARSWARRACSVANRTLTRDEWEQYLPGRPYEPACAS
jgi:WD40 repeat protein